MRNERERTFAGRRTATPTPTAPHRAATPRDHGVVRPRLRWTTVTGPDGRARLEMRWDAAAPTAPRSARPAA